MLKRYKRNISPSQNQGCTVWPLSQIATCTACLHHTAAREAVQGTCTDRSAWARPPDRMPGLFWWTQQTTRVSQEESNDKGLAYLTEFVHLCLSHWGLPKEATEVLSTAGGPEEDPIVSSQSWRHNVAFCLATRVPLTIMDHPKTGQRNEKKQVTLCLHITRQTLIDK